jgi:hypothetical protein
MFRLYLMVMWNMCKFYFKLKLTVSAAKSAACQLIFKFAGLSEMFSHLHSSLNLCCRPISGWPVWSVHSGILPFYCNAGNLQ